MIELTGKIQRAHVFSWKETIFDQGGRRLKLPLLLDGCFTKRSITVMRLTPYHIVPSRVKDLQYIPRVNKYIVTITKQIDIFILSYYDLNYIVS